jgi:hypothetical protein
VDGEVLDSAALCRLDVLRCRGLSARRKGFTYSWWRLCKAGSAGPLLAVAVRIARAVEAGGSKLAGEACGRTLPRDRCVLQDRSHFEVLQRAGGLRNF